MIVVVPVLVFVSFSFGEVSMDSPVQSKCIGIISAMQSEVNLLLSQANIERIDRYKEYPASVAFSSTVHKAIFRASDMSSFMIKPAYPLCRCAGKVYTLKTVPGLG